MAQPATIKFSFKIEMFEKFFPSFMTAPGYVESLISIFEPAPKIKILPLFE